MSEDRRPIPVAVAFTINYFVPVATCLYSVLKYSDPTDSFHFICLLSEDLPEHLKAKLGLLCKGRATCSFVNLKGHLRDIYVDSKYTEAASYRLILPDLLADYDKVIYIDCDIVVRNNLASLFRSVELGEHYMAAVFEAPLDFQIERFRAIGCNPMEYINSGFLLMNLQRMRKDDLVPKFLEASKVKGMEFPDQDVLNRICKGHILGLPPYCNSIRTFYLPQYKQSFLRKYTVDDYREVQQHGNVHYTGAKPWNHFTIEFVLWWSHYEELPEAIQKEWTKKRSVYMLYVLCRHKYIGRMIFQLQKIYRIFRYKQAE